MAFGLDVLNRDLPDGDASDAALQDAATDRDLTNQQGRN